MILSAELLYSDDQAITATAASTNVIDHGAKGTPYGAVGGPGVGIGEGEPVPLDIMVTEDFNTLTSLNIALQMDDNEAFSSPTTLWDIDVVLADLVVGYNVPQMYIPAGITERYTRLNYTVTGTNPTTGQITAGITGGRQTNQ